VKGRLKADVNELPLAEEALRIGVVERLHADDMGAGRQPGDLEVAVAIQREARHEAARRRVERRDVRTEHAGAAARDTPASHPGLPTEGVVRVQVRNAGDIVGLQLTIVRHPAAERDRKHHRARREHAAPPFGAGLRFAERRMAEAEQMADLVNRDRFEIEGRRIPRRRRRPGHRGVEKDVRLEDLARNRIDQKAGRAEDAVHPGMILEAEYRRPVVVERLGAGEADELEPDRGGRDRLPRRKRTGHRRLEVRCRHATGAAVPGKPPDGRPLPRDRDRLPRARRRKVQVRVRRLCERQNGRDDQRSRPHRRRSSGAPNARTVRVGVPRMESISRANASSGIGPRAGAPRMTTAGAPVWRATLYTPWLRPTSAGTAGARPRRKTTTSSPSANSGAPTTARR
jgi:hypothetical protein